jgi:hypothetical protein
LVTKSLNLDPESDFGSETLLVKQKLRISFSTEVPIFCRYEKQYKSQESRSNNHR